MRLRLGAFRLCPAVAVPSGLLSGQRSGQWSGQRTGQRTAVPKGLASGRLGEHLDVNERDADPRNPMDTCPLTAPRPGWRRAACTGQDRAEVRVHR